MEPGGEIAVPHIGEFDGIDPHSDATVIIEMATGLNKENVKGIDPHSDATEVVEMATDLNKENVQGCEHGNAQPDNENKHGDIIRKLPELGILYWTMKILATTLGETFADMISMTMGEGYSNSSAILFGIFFFTLAIQLYTKRYYVLVYWPVIMSTSLAGTCLSDFMDRTAGLGYAKGMSTLLGILIAIFLVWWLSGQSFAVTGAMTRSAELFYWLAIVVSNTLGTALGDFTSDTLDLGFGGGAGLYGGLMLATGLLALFTSISRVLLFWVWFVLTRPFGATFGDVFTKDTDRGGLGLGTEESSAIFASPLILLLILAVVLEYRKGTQRPAPPAAAASPGSPAGETAANQGDETAEPLPRVGPDDSHAAAPEPGDRRLQLPGLRPEPMDLSPERQVCE